MFRFALIWFAGYFAITGQVYAQSCKTDAPCIYTREALRKSIDSDARNKLVALKKLIPDLVLDIRYATTNNFTKTILYHHPVACLRREPAMALKQVQEELNRKGLSLKLFDGFRPFAVTCRIWQLVPDRHYAANPRKGSNHNRGVAVDITLVDMKTGMELNMGTPYDNFTDTAHLDFYNLPADVLANRKLLKTVMRKYGFDIVPTEWWHFQWKNRAGYEMIDLDFDALKEFID